MPAFIYRKAAAQGNPRVYLVPAIRSFQRTASVLGGVMRERMLQGPQARKDHTLTMSTHCGLPRPSIRAGLGTRKGEESQVRPGSNEDMRQGFFSLTAARVRDKSRFPQRFSDHELICGAVPKARRASLSFLSAQTTELHRLDLIAGDQRTLPL